MGIYNPMMKLPNSCYRCPYAFDCSVLINLLGENWDSDNLWDYDLISNKHKECPLIEIPTTHGDLIDRSELFIERISEAQYGPDVIYGVTKQELDSASAIIKKE